MTSLNIIFAGTPAFGLPCLAALKEAGHRIKAIYTQPDRPAGRGRKLQASPIKEWALAENIPVYQPLNFKDASTIEELKALEADVMVVIAYGLILPKAVLETPKLGCINVHASLLPRWRGASPIQHAILHGDRETGVTIMQMDVGMDTGDMLKKASCTIEKEDTAETLHDKLAAISVAPLLQTLDELTNATAKPEVQNSELATYAGKINKEEARIHWQDSAATIDQKIRAFHPWPVAFTHLNESVLRIHQASVLHEEVSAPPGTIIHLDKYGMDVATGNGILRIEKIQFAGGKIIRVADWLNASRDQNIQTLCLK